MKGLMSASASEHDSPSNSLHTSGHHAAGSAGPVIASTSLHTPTRALRLAHRRGSPVSTRFTCSRNLSGKEPSSSIGRSQVCTHSPLAAALA